MTEVPNLNYIKEVAGGNEEFEQRFLNIIQDEFPKEKEEYLSLLGEGEFEEAGKVVHKIKHKLGILSMNGSYQMAIQYEEDLQYGDMKLKEDFFNVLQIVEAFITKNYVS